MGPPPLDPGYARRLLAFARWHTLTLDLPDATRLSIEFICRRLDAGDLDARDRDELIERLDEYLITEIASRHR